MEAIILAGGKAERLGDAAGGRPKALVEVAGRPLAAYQVGRLANAGVTRIVYGEFYRDDRIFDIAKQIGIELVHVPLPGVTLPKLPPQGPG